MNFSLDDRVRSVRRWLSASMDGEAWSLHVLRVAVKDERRPAGVVEASTPAVTVQARTTVPQGDVMRRQTFSIALYPEFMEDGDVMSPADAAVRANAVAERLAASLLHGLMQDVEEGEPPETVSVSYSPPERLPVWDYADVPTVGAGRAGPAEPYGWLTVEDYPVRTIQDPEDQRRWTVVCDLRVSWWQGGRVAPDAPIVSEMDGDFEPA